uniref:Ig-like domain-containing protein n=1 Tax=Cyprinus carpio TaxID=7962 RepID=A0A8C1Z590_CYPCA
SLSIKLYKVGNLITCLFFDFAAYLSEIIARGHTVVEFGQDASFSCTLSDASGVKQVNWQRVRDQEPIQTLATFSEFFKQQVDDQYVGKVTFTAASVNSTINGCPLLRVCVHCSVCVHFGWVKCRAQILMNPALSSDPDVVVSCSATGKPTPTIHWKSAEKELDNFSSNFTTLNKDSSTTITSDLTLPLSQFHGEYVECVAQSDSMEKSSQISFENKNVKSSSHLSGVGVKLKI